MRVEAEAFRRKLVAGVRNGRVTKGDPSLNLAELLRF
jgi:hypothetical protein